MKALKAAVKKASYYNNGEVCMCHGRVAGRTRETRGKVNNGI